MAFPISFNIRDRGATPRGMAKRINAMKKSAWNAAGLLFHTDMRDQRFSQTHANQAGYARRSPKYIKRKQKRMGHSNPLQFSGRTRRAVRAARISATSNGAKVTYAGARVLNFRNPKSQVNAAVEFATITQAEADKLAAKVDQVLDRQLSADQQEN